jgi:hypothetical protein
MTDHPLTDEICKQIVEDNVHWHPDWAVLDLVVKTCMRASYDTGQKDGIEQVIEWIEDEGFYDHITYDPDYGVQTYDSGFIANLKKAMRPQQQEN